MARSRKVEGTCRICGTYGRLSFEHVPPRAAFNDRPMLIFSAEVLLEHGLDAGPEHGTVSQRGSGAYTLCERCNNNTGSWYGRHFVEWSYHGMEILRRSKGRPTLFYLNYLFPLPILKQVVSMFFSVNTERFRLAQPYLVGFVLDRERKYLPPGIRIYAYYTTSVSTRALGVSGMLNLESGRVAVTSEISFPPFGYVMTFDDNTPVDRRLVEITQFARYNYSEFAVLNIQLPVLETHLPLPGDYRTRAEILADRERNDARASQRAKKAEPQSSGESQ